MIPRRENRYIQSSAAYVPFFWEEVNEARYSEGDNRQGRFTIATFRVTAEHRRRFPDLKRRRAVHIVDDDNVVFEPRRIW